MRKYGMYLQVGQASGTIDFKVNFFGEFLDFCNLSILSSKMAEGDIILLQTIKKLFPENEEHFTKLGDFTTDFVLEVTAKLLNVIHSPNKPFKNVKPPSTYLLTI